MSGYRFHPGYTRVGGVLYDFNDRVLDRIQAVLGSFPKVYSDMEKLLFRNRIFLDRVRGVGVLSKADAIAYSCTGPIARASGVTYDLRKDEPYLAYPELRFRGSLHRGGRLLGAVHRADGGDAAEPPHPRAGPRRSSPPDRSTCRSPRSFPLPDKLTTYNSMEGLIQHFELIMPNRGVETPHDEVYAAVESPNGELGYYLVADGSQTAWRVRTRPPSFIHFAVFPHIIKDYMLADVVAVLGSLNIIAAELDR